MRDNGGGEDAVLRNSVEGGGVRVGGVPEAPFLSSNDCSRYDGWLLSSFVRNLRAFCCQKIRLWCFGEASGPRVPDVWRTVRGGAGMGGVRS